MSKGLKIFLSVFATLITIGGSAGATYLYTNDVKQKEITQLTDQIDTLKTENEALNTEIRKLPVVTEIIDTENTNEESTEKEEEKVDTEVTLPVDTTKYGTFTGNYIAGVSGDLFPAKLCFESLNNFGSSYCYYSTNKAEFAGPRSIPVGQYTINITGFWPQTVDGSKIYKPQYLVSYTPCQNSKPNDPDLATKCKIENQEISRLRDECKTACTTGTTCDTICSRYARLHTEEKNGLYGIQTNIFTINEGQNTDIGTIMVGI